VNLSPPNTNPSVSESHTQSEQLFFNPEKFFSGLLNDIREAKKEIIIETYIFRTDELGNQFIDALKDAAKRGVHIRLIIDGIGSYFDTHNIAKELDSPLCQVRIFHPLPWDFSVYHRALISGNNVSKVLAFIANINRRNHRKLYVIDDHIAWLGSFNITADHYNNTLGDRSDDWHDTGLRITGNSAEQLKTDFEEIWQRKVSPPSTRARRFFSNHSIRARKERNQILLNALSLSEQRIWITNAYFNPSPKLINALKAASKRGTCVRVIVPALSDVIFFPVISRSYYVDLLNAGIRIYEYRNKVLHSKTMLIDENGVVGSTNLNFRSLFHDLELDAKLTEPENIRILENKFRDDLEQCREITLEKWAKYPRTLKMLGWMSRFLRYWL